MIDFADLAGHYDRLRPAGEGWQEIADAALEQLTGATRLLDVGCGTGRFAVLAAQRLGARVWGIDPSPEMLAQARRREGARQVGWRQAAAERLPFRNGWFDAAHLHLVVHLLEDRVVALRELARVLSPGGRLAAVSFRTEHFDGFYLNPYFPSIARIDRARFPAPTQLGAELAAAGFGAVADRAIDQPVSPEPDELLERVRGRYISTLQLLDEREYADGLHRLEKDLAAGARPGGTLRWSLLSARRRP